MSLVEWTWNFLERKRQKRRKKLEKQRWNLDKNLFPRCYESLQESILMYNDRRKKSESSRRKVKALSFAREQKNIPVFDRNFPYTNTCWKSHHFSMNAKKHTKIHSQMFDLFLIWKMAKFEKDFFICFHAKTLKSSSNFSSIFVLWILILLTRGFVWRLVKFKNFINLKPRKVGFLICFRFQFIEQFLGSSTFQFLSMTWCDKVYTSFELNDHITTWIIYIRSCILFAIHGNLYTQ